MADSRTEISSDLIKSVLNDYLESKLGTAEFEMKIDPGSKEGENFIGVIYRITYWQKFQSNVKSQLIVKVSPQNEARREQFFSRPSFLREIYLYGKVKLRFIYFSDSKFSILFFNLDCRSYPHFVSSKNQRGSFQKRLASTSIQNPINFWTKSQSNAFFWKI